MQCQNVVDLLETYIAGDLSDSESYDVAAHLAACEACADRYDVTRQLVGDLRELADAFVPAERFSAAPLPVRGRNSGGWRLATVAASVAAILSMTALAVPAIARQLPTPLGAELGALEDENEALRVQVDELTVRLEDVGGEQVPVVDTTPGDLAPEVNTAVQMLAMEFVRAQYARDLDALKAMGTERLKADIAAHPADYLRTGGEAVVFAQMTEAAQAEDGTFLMFVRLMDAAEWADSQYQEDFEIKLIDGQYLVDFMGMDA